MREQPGRATIDLWRIVLLILAAALFAVFAYTIDPPRVAQQEVLGGLRAIDRYYAVVQRDVLLVRAGLLHGNETLPEAIEVLHQVADRLSVSLSSSGLDNPEELRRDLSGLIASIQSDDHLIQRFISENEVFQNSLMKATHSLSLLNQSSDPCIRAALSEVADLGNLFMRFVVAPDSALSEKIQSYLKKLERSDLASGRLLETYIVQARQIIVSLTDMDETLRLIQASGTPIKAQEFQRQYRDSYQMAETRSHWSRLILGGVSALLCGFILVLIYRLRSQASRLTQKLDYEGMVARLKRLFAEETGEQADIIAAAMDELATFFRADTHYFALASRSSGSVQSAAGTIDRETADRLMHHFQTSFIAPSSAGFIRKDFFLEFLVISAVHSAHGSLAGYIIASHLDENKSSVVFLAGGNLRRRLDAYHEQQLREAAGTLFHCVRLQLEHTEKLALESRLEHAHRLEAIGTLAGGIAHEFNNSLGAILGYSEMSLQIAENPVRTQQYLREIVSSGHRARHIVDQILTFSRKRERVSGPFRVNEAVSGIVPLLRHLIVETIGVSIVIEDDLPAIIGNPVEMQQVIMNLCSNAANACADGDRIEIKIARYRVEREIILSHGILNTGAYVWIQVADNGRGIAPAFLPQIFEPFFTTRAKNGGTGLGLATVHGCVMAMNGQIDVVSEVDCGTQFSLYFPETEDSPVAVSQFFNEAAVPLGNGEVVLLGQPDDHLRLLYEEKIAALGYEAIGFSTFEALNDWLQDNIQTADLLLLDLDLWHHKPSLRDIQAALLPARVVFVMDPEKSAMTEAELSGHITLRKPINTTTLTRVLRQQIFERNFRDGAD